MTEDKGPLKTELTEVWIIPKVWKKNNMKWMNNRWELSGLADKSIHQ